MKIQIEKDSRGGIVEKRINFSGGYDEIEGLLSREGIQIPPSIISDFFMFLSKIQIYEEEEKKIIPEIIVGHNLTGNLFSKYFQCEVLTLTSQNNEQVNVGKCLKPIIPFCDNGWRIFVDFDFDEVKFGIMRSFAGPLSVSLVDNLLTSSGDKALGNEFKYVLIDVMSRYEIKLFSSSGESLEIDYRLVFSEAINRRLLINTLVDDLTSQLTDRDRIEEIKNAYRKLFSLCPKRVHGAICLIIKDDCALPLPGILEDGVILKEPIDITSALRDLLSTPDVPSLHEKYYAVSGLLLQMLNTDGITIVDSRGIIRGYNFFIKSSAEDESVVGGARKRAARTLIRSRNPAFIGIYFQSQDGEISYERMNNIE